MLPRRVWLDLGEAWSAFTLEEFIWMTEETRVFFFSFLFFFSLPSAVMLLFMSYLKLCEPSGEENQKQSLVKLTRTSWKGGAAPSAASSENSWDSTLPPYHCCDSVIAWWSRNEFCLLVAVSRCIVGSLIEFPLRRWLTLKHSTINTWFETKNLERKLDESDCPFGWIYHTIVSCFFFQCFYLLLNHNIVRGKIDCFKIWFI